MTATHQPFKIMSDCANDALIDQLRACHTKEDILGFEKWFNEKIQNQKLSVVICDLLKNRSISRALAAKWLSTLLDDREEKLVSK